MENIRYEKRAQLFICGLVIMVIAGIINSFFSTGAIYLFIGTYIVGLLFTYLFNYLVKNFVLNKMKNIKVKVLFKFIFSSLIVLSIGTSVFGMETGLKNYLAPLIVWFVIDLLKLGFKLEKVQE